MALSCWYVRIILFVQPLVVEAMRILHFTACAIVTFFVFDVISLLVTPSDLRILIFLHLFSYLFDEQIFWFQAGGFGLLVIGPSYLPANEVSLFFLIETILGPVLVYLGGYEAPPKFTLYGGICLIFALAMNRLENE